jgi:hypothetical protein
MALFSAQDEAYFIKCSLGDIRRAMLAAGEHPLRVWWTLLRARRSLKRWQIALYVAAGELYMLEQRANWSETSRWNREKSSWEWCSSREAFF